jgi:hypothetical protein
MMQIAALLPPEYRGVYHNLESATDRYLRFRPGAESNLQRVQRSSQSATGAVTRSASGATLGPRREHEGSQ